jgi:patatin-like phospholipase/acyl hydrolase
LISLSGQLFDYTAVVFGQDADHELTEAEKEVQEKQQATLSKSRSRQSSKRRKNIMYRWKNKKGQDQSTVKRYDPNDPHQETALQNNEAVVVDSITSSTSAEDAMEQGLAERSTGHSATKHAVQQPIMRADAQNVGGLVLQSET